MFQQWIPKATGAVPKAPPLFHGHNLPPKLSDRDLGLEFRSKMNLAENQKWTPKYMPEHWIDAAPNKTVKSQGTGQPIPALGASWLVEQSIRIDDTRATLNEEYEDEMQTDADSEVIPPRLRGNMYFASRFHQAMNNVVAVGFDPTKYTTFVCGMPVQVSI